MPPVKNKPPVKTQAVVDSSAILAYFNDEPGWQNVVPYIGNCLISSVNAAEVVGTLVRNGIEASKARQTVLKFVTAVIPFTQQQAFMSGEMISQSKPLGLSLGDRACLSLALDYALLVITSDRIWHKLRLPIEIKVFR